MRVCMPFLATIFYAATSFAQGSAGYLVIPDRLFDAESGTTRPGWGVLVRGDRILAVGPRMEQRKLTPATWPALMRNGVPFVGIGK